MLLFITDLMGETLFRKYDHRNGMAMSGLQVSTKFQEEAQGLVNSGKSFHSWKAMRAMQGLVRKWATMFSEDLSLPWNEKKINTFICIGRRLGKTPGTVRSYISRMKKLHQLELGITLESHESSRELLKGWERLQEEPPKKRIAVTPYILLKLKVS